MIQFTDWELPGRTLPTISRLIQAFFWDLEWRLQNSQISTLQNKEKVK
jgi:hypothetical protein